MSASNTSSGKQKTKLRLLNERTSYALNRERIDVGSVEYTRTKIGHRITCLINSEPVWFESTTKLSANPLAFAALMLLPSLKRAAYLKLAQAPDKKTLENFRKIALIAHEWWDYSKHLRLSGKRAAFSMPTKKARRTGLCFSCGADSFATLFERMDGVDDLVLVHGFDVAINDIQRFEELSKHALAVAEATGKRLIIVKTNLRKHLIYQKINWEITHGAALAAIGHLLHEEFGHLLISASFPSTNFHPWGSSARMDPLWSSKTLSVEHVGDDRWRSEKIKSLCHDPLYQANLVVCWMGREASMHCGRCEKCVRTMLILACAGVLDEMSTFPTMSQLPAALRGLESVGLALPVYENCFRSNLPSEVKKALEELLVRCGGRFSLSDGETGWTEAVVHARIDRSGDRKRFEGGSPNAAEVSAYESFLPSEKVCAETSAVVLGMTPELRSMAARRFAHLYSVDQSEASISAYGGWLDAVEQSRESVHRLDWRELRNLPLAKNPAPTAVLGDGIFGNLPDLEAHGQLLDVFAVFAPEAVFVFRKACVPQANDPLFGSFDSCLQRFLKDEIDAAEFGFVARLAGLNDRYYNFDTYHLQNGSIFAEYDRLYAEGRINQSAYDALQRYRFEKDNCLLTKSAWEHLLVDKGWTFQIKELVGRLWYPLYPVYCCRPPSR